MIVSGTCAKVVAAGSLVLLAEVSLLVSDVVPPGVGYDLLLGMVVLSVLGLIGWSVRYLLIEIVKPATVAHIKALEVLQTTTEQNRAALTTASGTLARMMTVIDEAVERGKRQAARAEADSHRLQAVEVAVRKMLDGLERVSSGSGVNLGRTRKEVEELIGPPENNDGGGAK